MSPTDPQALAADHHHAVHRHFALSPQGLRRRRDDRRARAADSADLRSLLRWDGRGQRLDHAAVGDDMHQLAVEPQGDLLSGELGRELDALPAEADVAVPADQPIDLDHERGLRPVGQGGRRWFEAGNPPAALHQRLQVGSGELGGAGAGEFAVDEDVDAALISPDGGGASAQRGGELQLLAGGQTQPADRRDERLELHCPDVGFVDGQPR